ncbi:class 1 fructose-bisphosphatase [Calditrichota bacterium]
MGEIITIDRHILDTERKYPTAKGRFTGLLQHIAMAAKIVAAEVRRAGIVGIIGKTGSSNVQGEEVQKLDIMAHETLTKLMMESGYLAVMASEEVENVISVPDDHRRGDYVVNFDPLDGSSNIDANVSIGTIFSILPRISSPDEQPSIQDCMQPGKNQIAAGYIIYGSSTMFVYTTGAGVHGFTYDPLIGEFVLSHSNIRTPQLGTIYSVNTGNKMFWTEGVRRYIESLQEFDPVRKTPYSMRYIGSMVSDIHRNLLYGGIFLYPADNKKDRNVYSGKLRLLYEASPLAFIIEQAGGRASDGVTDIMELMPTELHQRIPLYIGSKENLDELEAFIRKYDLNKEV